MSNNCVCCNSKISKHSTSYFLTKNDENQICFACYELLRELNQKLKNEESIPLAEEYARQLLDVAKSNFTPTGIEYVSKYIDYLLNLKRGIIKNVAPSDSNSVVDSHMLTTGFNFEGYKILEYISVISAEVVIGTGFLSEFSASISDIFGIEDSAFSKKLEEAKDSALKKIKLKSIRLGGNAIIGVDFDYITFSNNMIGVVVSGTSVLVEKNETYNTQLDEGIDNAVV